STSPNRSLGAAKKSAKKKGGAWDRRKGKSVDELLLKLLPWLGGITGPPGREAPASPLGEDFRAGLGDRVPQLGEEGGPKGTQVRRGGQLRQRAKGDEGAQRRARGIHIRLGPQGPGVMLHVPSLLPGGARQGRRR